jgi:hypothetical protein
LALTIGGVFGGPRQILHGLKAVQDDVNFKVCPKLPKILTVNFREYADNTVNFDVILSPAPDGRRIRGAAEPV